MECLEDSRLTGHGPGTSVLGPKLWRIACEKEFSASTVTLEADVHRYRSARLVSADFVDIQSNHAFRFM